MREYIPQCFSMPETVGEKELVVQRGRYGEKETGMDMKRSWRDGEAAVLYRAQSCARVMLSLRSQPCTVYFMYCMCYTTICTLCSIGYALCTVF